MLGRQFPALVALIYDSVYLFVSTKDISWSNVLAAVERTPVSA
jgi:hypothetical protein